MLLIRAVHIIAGALALLAGYWALFSAKGALTHRKSGIFFVYTMLTMAVLGVTISAMQGVAPAVNIPAGMMTSYFVITSLRTIRPEFGSRPLDVTLMLVALAISLVDLSFGVEAIANGGKRQGIPAFPFFLFGVFGLLATVGDYRILRRGALQGTARLARHLWRMNFALLIAALAFLPRLGRWLPKPVAIAGLAVPMLVLLITMFYWLWRVRRRPSHGIVVRVRPPDVVTAP